MDKLRRELFDVQHFVLPIALPLPPPKQNAAGLVESRLMVRISRLTDATRVVLLVESPVPKEALRALFQLYDLYCAALAELPVTLEFNSQQYQNANNIQLAWRSSAHHIEFHLENAPIPANPTIIMSKFRLEQTIARYNAILLGFELAYQIGRERIDSATPHTVVNGVDDQFAEAFLVRYDELLSECEFGVIMEWINCHALTETLPDETRNPYYDTLLPSGGPILPTRDTWRLLYDITKWMFKLGEWVLMYATTNNWNVPQEEGILEKIRDRSAKLSGVATHLAARCLKSETPLRLFYLYCKKAEFVYLGAEFAARVNLCIVQLEDLFKLMDLESAFERNAKCTELHTACRNLSSFVARYSANSIITAPDPVAQWFKDAILGVTSTCTLTPPTTVVQEMITHLNPVNNPISSSVHPLLKDTMPATPTKLWRLGELKHDFSPTAARGAHKWFKETLERCRKTLYQAHDMQLEVDFGVLTAASSVSPRNSSIPLEECRVDLDQLPNDCSKLTETCIPSPRACGEFVTLFRHRPDKRSGI